MPITISDYYRAALEQLKKEVDATADDQVRGMNLDKWVDYLVQKYQLEEIEIDTSRGERMVEEEVAFAAPLPSDEHIDQPLRTTAVIPQMARHLDQNVLNGALIRVDDDIGDVGERINLRARSGSRRTWSVS